MSLAALPAAIRLAQFGLPWRTSAVAFPDNAYFDGQIARPRSFGIAIDDDSLFKQTPPASSAARELFESAQICGEELACP
jgi:hypothetical protein